MAAYVSRWLVHWWGPAIFVSAGTRAAGVVCRTGDRLLIRYLLAWASWCRPPPLLPDCIDASSCPGALDLPVLSIHGRIHRTLIIRLRLAPGVFLLRCTVAVGWSAYSRNCSVVWGIHSPTGALFAGALEFRTRSFSDDRRHPRRIHCSPVLIVPGRASVRWIRTGAAVNTVHLWAQSRYHSVVHQNCSPISSANWTPFHSLQHRKSPENLVDRESWRELVS